jgi:outer membrane protein TolC
MLPTIDLVADVTNNGLSGQPNANFITDGGAENIVNPFFLGGLGNSLGQIFRRNFPDYSIGVQVRIPLRNRTAQADLAASLLEQRQATIRMRQLENSIRVEVQNAVIGLQQARAQHEAARKTRILQEQTLDAEQKKFNLGASTIFQVVQAQRDLALSRSAEVTAQNNYVKARVDLHRATGDILEDNNVIIEEAYRGQVSRPHDPIPQPQAQP